MPLRPAAEAQTNGRETPLAPKTFCLVFVSTTLRINCLNQFMPLLIGLLGWLRSAAEAQYPRVRYPENYGEHILSHINNGHAITITKLTDSSVTYLDNSITITQSKSDFLKIWDGDTIATHEAIKLLNPKPLPSLRILTDKESQSIRGAFWGSILSIVGWVLTFTPLAFLVPAIQLLSTAISAIEGDFISAIGSLVTFGMGSLGSVFGNIRGQVLP